MTLPSAKIHKIIAPAGCGKTTRLIEVVETLLKEGVAPDRIVYTTFTRSGAYEARDRAMEKFRLSENQLPFFRTMHSMCYRILGNPKLMTNKDWFEISRTTGVSFSPQLQSPFLDGPVFQTRIRKGDYIMACLAYARNSCLKPEEAYMLYAERDRFKKSELVHIAAEIRKYKALFGKIDFTDMLQMFLDRKPRLSIDYMIVDEAQDLTPLQWEVINHLGGFCKKIYVAGDDDQAIYEYSGADPRILIALGGTLEIRAQSYRVPSAIQQVSQSIVTKLRSRIDKTLKPRAGSPGTVLKHIPHDILDMSEGKWLCLCRNSHYFKYFEQLCASRGWMYETNRNSLFEKGLFEKISNWRNFHLNGTIKAEKLAECARLMKAGNHYRPGLIKHLENLPRDTDIDRNLATQLGMYRFETWDIQLSKLTKGAVTAYKGFETNNDFYPRITISTIHGVKGGECDNVAILPDMTYQSYKSYCTDPDPEHRLFYVGVTRAKEKLVLLQPITDKHYVF